MNAFIFLFAVITPLICQCHIPWHSYLKKEDFTLCHNYTWWTIDPQVLSNLESKFSITQSLSNVAWSKKATKYDIIKVCNCGLWKINSTKYKILRYTYCGKLSLISCVVKVRLKKDKAIMSVRQEIVSFRKWIRHMYYGSSFTGASCFVSGIYRDSYCSAWLCGMSLSL